MKMKIRIVLMIEQKAKIMNNVPADVAANTNGTLMLMKMPPIQYTALTSANDSGLMISAL